MLLIIDGNNMAYRAKYRFNLSNRGEDVSVKYGVLYMINSLLGHFPKVTSVAVCWDGGVPEFRRNAIPEYKANRHKDDDPLAHEDMVRQMKELGYILPFMGIVNLRRSGAEADDFIYHIAKMAAEPSIIITSDKDLIQTVDDNVSVYNPAQDRLYTPRQVEITYGISVSNYVHWRAIQGDNGDNIAGVPGIGEKTATKLFQECKSLTGITNAATGHNPYKALTGRLADSIAAFGLDRIARNTYVMALYADRVGVRLAIRQAVQSYMGAKPKIVKQYFLRNAFTSLLGSRLYGFASSNPQPPALKQDIIRTPVVAIRRTPV